ncbi:MAG: polymerase beta, Nucleotidyltransferase [Gemmatimonadetes bacterium]|nr:polymerase beta, Nucleotidyltransferase [Gemmatimonadota bacterium]
MQAPPRPELADSVPDVRDCLSPRALAAADEAVRRVRQRVPAALEMALLFGSRARGEARADSDVDVLLVFRRLAWDREPQAGMAERIAERVAEETGVPVATWTVSLADLRRGRRTPMLVDALEDGVPLWPRGLRVPRLPFTAADAVTCTHSLLDRIAEGSARVERLLADGRAPDAAKRARDDLVRMCTAALLLAGETRPRGAECIARFMERFGGIDRIGRFDGIYGIDPRRCDARFDGTMRISPRRRSLRFHRGAGVRRMDSLDDAVLRWAARSYGADGKDVERPVRPPPGGLPAAADLIDRLWRRVRRGAVELDRRRWV